MKKENLISQKIPHESAIKHVSGGAHYTDDIPEPPGTLFGAIGFTISGSLLDVDLPFSIGFINIPAFLIYTPITIILAKLGANTVHKIDKTIITKLFGLLNIAVSILLFFEYLNY